MYRQRTKTESYGKVAVSCTYGTQLQCVCEIADGASAACFNGNGTAANGLLSMSQDRHFPVSLEAVAVRILVRTGGMGPMRPGWGPIPMPAAGPIMGGHSG